MMEELIEILENVKPGVDFRKENKLIEEEVLDSFDIVNLVARINNEFDVEITPAELIPSNFESAEAIYNLILKLQEE